MTVDLFILGLLLAELKMSSMRSMVGSVDDKTWTCRRFLEESRQCNGGVPQGKVAGGGGPKGRLQRTVNDGDDDDG